ncbi:hypothetical protein Q9L58_004049 [Maublancomyces gigas]|uniref:Uncharacterized protein n=1 Tax=Discina gigas TaxID=1032678 RepID=A0ABR3GM12_9PEZI
MESPAEQGAPRSPIATSPLREHGLPTFSVAEGSTSSVKPTPPRPKFSTFLMNNIPRGTSHAKLTRYLLAQAHGPSALHQAHSPQVLFGSDICDSRLDDELSVATLEFSDTPPWLLNQDPSSFPKNTLLGTIWLGVDRAALDSHGRSEFIRAVINSHGRLGPLYAEMLAEFADTAINIQDNQGRTALHWACVEVLPDMVGLCLSIAEFNTGLRDNDGFTAFDLALRTGHDFLPNLFYSSMLETDESSPQTALLRVLTLSSDESSAENRPLFPGNALFPPILDRNSPLVVALLGRGVDLTTRDEAGNMVLHIAAGLVDNVDMVTWLLDAGSDINAIGNGGFTPLHNAVRSKDLEMVELLLQRKADVSITDNDDVSALDWAVQNGQLGIAHVLLQQRAGLGERDMVRCRAVDVAEENRNITVAKLLNTKDKPVEAAVPDPCKLPQNSDLPVTILSGSTTLLAAARWGDIAAVRTILAQGVDANSRNIYGNTVLDLAVERGHTEIVKTLILAGAAIEAVKNDGNRPLHWAVRRGYREVVKELLVAGADMEALNHDGNGALHLAVQAGRTDVVKSLLGAGAQIEAVDEHGNRPLHLAVQHGHPDIAKLPLAAGAQSDARNTEGKLTYDLALRDGTTEIVKIVRASTSVAGRLRSNVLYRLRKKE